MTVYKGPVRPATDSGRHAFICYAKADRWYVELLSGLLTDTGLAHWYDRKMKPGDQFVLTIQRKIDTCAAFIVVLTPAAIESDWVNREIFYALNRGKPIVPLRLSACNEHLLLVDRHYEDVPDGRMPGRRFLQLLRELLTG